MIILILFHFFLFLINKINQNKMLQSISPITGNSPINISLNLPIEDNQFSEIKNYILDLEKKTKNQEFEINNLKNTISTQEQEKLKYKSDLDKKESIIQELQTQIENYKNQSNQYENKINELENENKKINYSIIELTQKNKILSSNENNDKNQIPNQYLTLSDRLDEIEIIKHKLEFDNTKLINKINELLLQHDNEIKLLTKIKNGEINQLEKIISSLHEIINNNNIQNNILNENNQISNKNSSQCTQIIIEQISNIEKKMIKFKEQITNLEKENNNLKSQKNKLINDVENKNKIIQELKQKVINSNNDNKNKLKESKELIDKLTIEKDELLKENYELRSNFDKFNNKIKEANDLFNETTKSYTDDIKNNNKKIKDYRNKIQQLKLKINELIKEKEQLQKKLNDNEKKYLNQLNNKKDILFSPQNKKTHPIINNAINMINSKGLENKTNTHILNSPIDSYSESQQKSLEDFKKVLSKIDENIQINKELISLNKD